MTYAGSGGGDHLTWVMYFFCDARYLHTSMNLQRRHQYIVERSACFILCMCILKIDVFAKTNSYSPWQDFVIMELNKTLAL